MTSSLFESRSKVQTENGGKLQVVKSVTVPGKYSAISDGDWQVFPLSLVQRIQAVVFQSPNVPSKSDSNLSSTESSFSLSEAVR
jgi:hypothetical protein